MAETPRRPTEHHMVHPAVVPRRRTGPQEYPSAKATGDMAGSRHEPTRSEPVALSAETSAVLEALHQALPGALAAQEARMVGQFRLMVQTAVGAQQSAELTHANRRATRNRNTAITLGTALGLVSVAMAAAITTYRQYKADTQDVVVPVIEAKVDPLERRVASTEESIQDLDEDVAAVGRKVDSLTRAVAGLVQQLEQDETPQVRRRSR